MIVRGNAFFHEWEGALPFSGMSSSSALRLELLEQHRRVVADARVRERGELVRIGAAEERVHPFPHPGAARDAQLERGPAQHLVFVAGEQDIELASKVDSHAVYMRPECFRPDSNSFEPLREGTADASLGRTI